MKVEEHLRCIEGQAFSLIRDMSDPEGLLRSIVAFSNTNGGTLFIGIAEDKSVAGLKFPWHGEDRLLRLTRDSIRPLVLPRMEIVSMDEKNVLKVTVYPGPLRPYHLIEKGAFVTVGSIDRPADQGVIDSLSRLTVGRGFDEEPMPGLGPDALDLEGAAEILAPVRKTSIDELKALRILSDAGGAIVPTVGGKHKGTRNKNDAGQEDSTHTPPND